MRDRRHRASLSGTEGDVMEETFWTIVVYAFVFGVFGTVHPDDCRRNRRLRAHGARTDSKRHDGGGDNQTPHRMQTATIAAGPQAAALRTRGSQPPNAAKIAPTQSDGLAGFP
jgi:hypothetical protein